MVAIPPGRFRMGTLDNNILHVNAMPVHDVQINYSFAVGKYEVTYSEWDACVADGGCVGSQPSRLELNGFASCVHCIKYHPKDREWGWGRYPVTFVSWKDAKNYVSWLSRKTGQSYRLLSESEWEYVARAGTTTKYSWGNDIGRNRANCKGCGSQWDGKQTPPVGSFPANRFGLYDMHGNASELVEDCFNSNYSGGAPEDGSSWASGFRNCAMRSVRGGSWQSAPLYLHSATRWGSGSELPSGNAAGLRVARTLSQ